MTLGEAKRKARRLALERHHRLEDRWFTHDSNHIALSCHNCLRQVRIMRVGVSDTFTIEGYMIEQDCD